MLRLLMTLGLFTACDGGGGETTPGQADEGPTESQGPGKEPTAVQLGGAKDVLVIAYPSEPDSLLSPVYHNTADADIIGQVNLSPYSPEFDGRLTFKGQLYESTTWSPDHKVLTVKLRADAAWQDGTPLTTRDVRFTYDLLADPKVASPRVAFIEKMVPDKRPLIIDDHTLEFHFTEVYDETVMMAHAGLEPVPEHLLKDADRATLKGHALAKAPVASGPWKVEKWEPGQSLSLVPNEAFKGPDEWKPRLQRVIFKFIPEYATRLVELESGTVDMAPAIQPEDADRIAREHPEIVLYRRGWRTMEYVGWNSLDPEDYKAKKAALKEGETLDWSTVKPHPIFSDRATRRALAHAIDVQKLIKDLLTSSQGEVYGRPAVSTVTPALTDVHADQIKPLAFDPAVARAELEAAGWVDVNGDGFREKGDVALRFKLLTNSSNTRRTKAAVLVQAMLKDVGAEAQIEQVESTTFSDRLRRKDFDAAISGWSAGLAVDMTPHWHSGDRYEFNFPSYANPEVDRLIEGALAEVDPAGRNARWREAQAAIYEDQPYAFLYWLDEIVALHKRFKDAKIGILSVYKDLRSWWVPGSQVKYKL